MLMATPPEVATMADQQTTPAQARLAAIRQALTSSPALRRFQADELRQQAAQMVRDAEALEAEAAAMEAAHG